MKDNLSIRSAFEGRHVFVTGASGFKGAWLCEWLLALGARVTGFSHEILPAPALFSALGLASRIRHVTADIRDRAALAAALHEAAPDFVLHLAAQPLVRPSYREPVETLAVNVMGTAHLLEAVRGLNRPVVTVVVTSDKCYENREWLNAYREDDPMGGHDPYSASKGCAELVVSSFRRSFFTDPRVHGTVATARAGNVIGGGDWAEDRIVPDAMRALSAGVAIPVRNPHATRPWQHVLEPLSGYLTLAAALARPSIPISRSRIGNRDLGHFEPGSRSTGSSGGIGTDSREQREIGTLDPRPSTPPAPSALNFGPEPDGNRSVADLVTEILRHWPGKWEDRADPAAPHEAGLLSLAIDRAYHLLGWRPVWPFATGVEFTTKWYRDVCERGANPAERTRRDIDAYTSAAKQLNLPWAG